MNVPIIGHPNGTTRALSEVTIRARVKGFLKEKHFDEGSNVKKDQLLLVIDEEPFKVKVAQAKAVLEEAEAALKKAQRVEVARRSPRPRWPWTRPSSSSTGSRSAGSATCWPARPRRRKTTTGPRPRPRRARRRSRRRRPACEQATADYDINILSAQAKIEQAKADLEAAQIDLGYCRMFSPIDGRTGELQVKLGNLVGPGRRQSSDTTSLVTIQQLDPMGVDIRPASRYLPLIDEAREERSGGEA